MKYYYKTLSELNKHFSKWFFSLKNIAEVGSSNPIDVIQWKVFREKAVFATASVFLCKNKSK